MKLKKYLNYMENQMETSSKNKKIYEIWVKI